METPTATPSTSATDPAAEGEDARPEPGGYAHWRLSLAVLVAVTVADHLSKWWAIVSLQPLLDRPGRGAITIVPGCFELRYGTNTGAAFSMFEGATGLLALVSTVAVAALFWWWRSSPAREIWGRIAFALIAGGAIGNLIDRVLRGYVVDMFHAFIGEYSWPIFNVADSAICVGVGILMVRVLRGRL